MAVVNPAGTNHNVQYFGNSGFPSYVPGMAGSTGHNFYNGDYSNSMLTVGHDPNDASPNYQTSSLLLGSPNGCSALMTEYYGSLSLQVGYVNNYSTGTQVLIINPTGGHAGGVFTQVNGDDFRLGDSLGTTRFIGNGAIRGVATLSGGTVTVSAAGTDGSAMIQLTVQTLGTVTVPQAMYVSNMTASVFPSVRGSFDITSADPTDTSTVAWFIIN